MMFNISPPKSLLQCLGSLSMKLTRVRTWVPCLPVEVVLPSYGSSQAVLCSNTGYPDDRVVPNQVASEMLGCCSVIFQKPLQDLCGLLNECLPDNATGTAEPLVAHCSTSVALQCWQTSAILTMITLGLQPWFLAVSY